MLRTLSIRNARRQFREYTLFFVTLACVVSFMYAFHGLIFSDSVKVLSNMEILPYMIVASSLLIVLIMGWIIGWMVNYMLKKRSREFCIYMVSGLSNRNISRLVFYENIWIGLLALAAGLSVGTVLSMVLEWILCPVLGVACTTGIRFSLPAAGLTVFFFLMMLLYSLHKNRRWLRRATLYELLYYERENEKNVISGSPQTVGIFILSLVSGGAGILILYLQPWGKGYDILAGTILLILFLFAFFQSLPAFLAARFGADIQWKYSKNRLTGFREFTGKIHSSSTVMGVLSVLFLLAMTFTGTGIVISMTTGKIIQSSPFDVMILHKGKVEDAAEYDRKLQDYIPIRESYSYGIYTDKRKEFTSKHSKDFLYAEYESDTCMAQKDYQKLRQILGYESVELEPSSCYIHCVPALKKDFETYIGQTEKPECAGYPFAREGVFSEAFCQGEAYGNGLDYVIIVPDQAVRGMDILYGIYAAVTDSPLTGSDIQNITAGCQGLKRLDRGTAKSVPGSESATALGDNTDYLSGKWMERESLVHLYALLVCLFYLALILEITGTAVLGTQILSDRVKKEKQVCILRQLGMSDAVIARQRRGQIGMMFLFPFLPAFVCSSAFVYICARKIEVSAFRFPAFSGDFWFGQSVGISLLVFICFYGIYFLLCFFIRY